MPTRCPKIVTPRQSDFSAMWLRQKREPFRICTPLSSELPNHTAKCQLTSHILGIVGDFWGERQEVDTKIFGAKKSSAVSFGRCVGWGVHRGRVMQCGLTLSIKYNGWCDFGGILDTCYYLLASPYSITQQPPATPHRGTRGLRHTRPTI